MPGWNFVHFKLIYEYCTTIVSLGLWKRPKRFFWTSKTDLRRKREQKEKYFEFYFFLFFISPRSQVNKSFHSPPCTEEVKCFSTFPYNSSLSIFPTTGTTETPVNTPGSCVPSQSVPVSPSQSQSSCWIFAMIFSLGRTSTLISSLQPPVEHVLKSVSTSWLVFILMLRVLAVRAVKAQFPRFQDWHLSSLYPAVSPEFSVRCWQTNR